MGSYYSATSVPQLRLLAQIPIQFGAEEKDKVAEHGTEVVAVPFAGIHFITAHKHFHAHAGESPTAFRSCSAASSCQAAGHRGPSRHIR